MTFIWPVMLVLLVLIPLCVIFYFRLQQRRRAKLEKIGSLGFIQVAGGGQAGKRRFTPALIFLAGLALMLIALARPQTVVSIPNMESTVILAFDVSGSMAADDINPSRLEAAKTAAQAFVQRQPDNVLIGVVAFSDGGMSVQAPTNDQETILAAIKRLTPERSTSLGNGILAGLKVIAGGSAQPDETDGDSAPLPTPTSVPQGTYIPAAIILLTDGENTASPDPLEVAQEAARRGVRVYTIGIGSAGGAALQIDGFTVFTRLDEAMLKTIAQLTDAEYFNAQSEQDLLAVYQNLDPQWVLKAQKMEVTSIFAGLSLLVLIAGALLSLMWTGRLA